MKLDNVEITIVVIAGVIFGFLIAFLVENGISQSCDLQGSFISGGDVYDCTLREAE